jgi:hypothetical protein
MILGRVDVAGRPAHIRAKMRQCLDENRGLDRHVERTGDSRAAQWLLRPILLPRRHQAGHLGFRNIDLVPAPGRERNIFDDVVAGLRLWLGSGHGNPSTDTNWGWLARRAYNRPMATSQRIYKDFFM